MMLKQNIISSQMNNLVLARQNKQKVWNICHSKH
uniref:Uncharacterized protein n=1 Tax=Anguilla anguilla TaxID=7936 RepID=A0A0E9SX58_ANGAN